MKSGLYIVSLRNRELISVNAQDLRRAHKTIKVNYENCKFGKAEILDSRKKNYEKTFGSENVIFQPIVALAEIGIAEEAILTKLDLYRIRGRTGRKNEWLQNINPQQVERIIFETLSERQIAHIQIGTTFEEA